MAGEEHPPPLEAGGLSAPAPASTRPTTGLVVFKLDTTYLSLQSLTDDIRRVASENGFRVKHNPKDYFNEKDWPHEESVPFASVSIDNKELTARRGYFICSPKSECREKNSLCTFQVAWGWEKKVGLYVFRPKSSCLQHSHLLPEIVDLQGKRLVKLEGDLTHAEEAYIQEKCLCKMDIPNMQINLERNFPGRCFSAAMLYRIRKKVLDAQYGADRNQLYLLIDYGEAIRKDTQH